MKYLLSFICVFSLFGIVFGQTGIEYMDVKMDASKLEEANADLSQVEIDFCDREGEKNIEYTLAPGGTQDICYKATNYSDKDITVTVGFVDGAFTNDEWKNKACKQQGEIEEFGKYVTGYTETFTVEANNIRYQHANLQLPKETRGIVNGCLVYYTKGVEMGGQMNFTVLVRKAKFIDVNVRNKGVGTSSKQRGIIFGVIVLLLFFSKFHKQKKTAYKK